MLIKILNINKRNNNMIKYRCLVLCFILREVKWNKKNYIRQQYITRTTGIAAKALKLLGQNLVKQ